MIRRGLSDLDLPFRTVIRGDWTIDKYELGVKQAPDRFTGPFLAGPRGPIRGGEWQAPMALGLESLPATDADVASIERDASNALGGRSLDGLPHFRLLAAGISDFLRASTRVEGITASLGARLAIGSTVARGRVGIGLSDQRMIGGGSLVRTTGADSWTLHADRVVQDLSDTPILSGLSNSLSTLTSGDDYGDYTLIDRVGIARATTVGRTRVALDISREWSHSVETAFTPISGTVTPNPALGAGAAWVVRTELSHHDIHGRGWSLDAEGGEQEAPWYRLLASANGHIALPTGELLLSGSGGLLEAMTCPAIARFAHGGRKTLLGVPFRAIGGRQMVLGEIAWAIPVALPTPPFPYSRWIRLPSVVAPYLAAGVASGDEPALPWRGTGTIEPVAGLRLDLWGPLFRIETGDDRLACTGQIGVNVLEGSSRLVGRDVILDFRLTSGIASAPCRTTTMNGWPRSSDPWWTQGNSRR